MSVDAATIRTNSRRLWNLIEPIASSIYFAPEAHANYSKLGLEGFGEGYFTSRAACMGEVSGEVVTATFAVFNPAIVIPPVETGWTKTDAASVLAAREDGAITSLTRMLGGLAKPDDLARATEIMRAAGEKAAFSGRPLYAGLRSIGFPGDPVGDMWRAADVLREHRGDSHIIAWVGRGVSPVEINLLTELYWGLALNTYIRTRGWSADEIEAGIESTKAKGWTDGEKVLPAGDKLREDIEAATDEGEREVVDAIGRDADELFGLLEPWTKAVLEAKGYPRDPAAVGRP
jgi:hypothetical protein